jgi:hypothetical protein
MDLTIFCNEEKTTSKVLLQLLLFTLSSPRKMLKILNCFQFNSGDWRKGQNYDTPILPRGMRLRHNRIYKAWEKEWYNHICTNFLTRKKFDKKRQKKRSDADP